MAMTAIYYGYPADSEIGIWVIAFYQTLMGFIIYFILKFLITKRMPTDININQIPKKLKIKETFKFKYDHTKNDFLIAHDFDDSNSKLSNNNSSYNRTYITELSGGDDNYQSYEKMMDISMDRKQKMHKKYLCKNWCKYVSYIIGILISIVCYIIIIIYSVFFDLSCSNKYKHDIISNCTDTRYNISWENTNGVDISLEDELNYNITQYKIDNIINAFGISDDNSSMFILNTVYSSLLSFLVVSPLLLLLESIYSMYCPKFEWYYCCIIFGCWEWDGDSNCTCDYSQRKQCCEEIMIGIKKRKGFKRKNTIELDTVSMYPLDESLMSNQSPIE